MSIHSSNPSETSDSARRRTRNKTPWEIRLIALNNLAAETTAAKDRRELEKLITCRAAEILQVPSCLLCSYDESTGNVTLLSENKDRGEREFGLTVNISESPSAQKAVQTGKLTMVREDAVDTSLSGALRRLFGYGSMVHLPLKVRDKTVGLLTLSDKVQRIFNEDEKDLAYLLGRQVAATFENARLLEATKDSEERLAQVIHSIREGMIVLDPKGNILIWNREAESISGIPAQRMVGRNFYSKNNPYFTRNILEGLEKAQNSSRSTVLQNKKNPMPTGKVPIFDLRTFPMNDGAMTIFFSDVTPQVNAEQERRQLEEKVRALDRLESIGRLAGGIAHDFNNLLGAVLGHVSHIRTRIKNGTPLDSRLTHIEFAAERAADLAKQLLAFARGGKYKVDDVDMREVCDESVTILHSTSGHFINYHSDYPDMLSAVEGDSSQLAQIVMNIGVNARDAMPDGGEFTLRLSEVPSAPPVLDDGRPPIQGPFILLEATDTGCGMPENVRSRIFEPFYSTKAKGKGTGLGMAVVYGIVKNHDGYVYVDSAAGKGTKFRVYLPAKGKPIPRAGMQEAFSSKRNMHPPGSSGLLPPVQNIDQLIDEDDFMEGAEEVSGSGSGIKRGKSGEHSADDFSSLGTILIIEDEEALRDLLTETLEEEGYDTITCETGKEGIRAYHRDWESQRKIKLVVLDMMLPDSNGNEVFKALHDTNPKVQVLITSGYTNADAAGDLLASGVAGFLAKPYRVNDIVNLVGSMIKKPSDNS